MNRVIASLALGAMIAASACRPDSDVLPPSLVWNRSAPKVVVLLHGATEPPGRAAEPRPGTIDHAKDYWGFAFCSRLVGAYAYDSRAYLPGLRSAAPPPPSPADSASRLRTSDGHLMTLSNWGSTQVSETETADHFYVSGSDPNLSVMLTYRDGSRRLIPQAAAAIDQIYDKLQAQFPGEKPSLILVGHSMGGLVARYLLSAPLDPIAGESLTANQKTKAAWIRDRTLFCVTLATPHEGSPLATKYQVIGNYLSDKIGFLQTALRAVGFDQADPQGWMRQLIGLTPSLDHLRPDFWRAANQGPLAPQRMARADGTLIPVYALGGRTPSGPYFSNPNDFPSGGIGLEGNSMRTFKALGLMILDWGLRNAPGAPTGWGGLSKPPGINFDEVRRGNTEFSLSGRKFVSPPAVVPIVNCDGLPFFYVGGQGDGEPDTDGMVSIQSALGTRLGTSKDLYFDHSQAWPIEGKSVTGSWYRLPSGPWNGANHDTICHAPQVADWLRRNVFDKAGPLPNAGPISVWP